MKQQTDKANNQARLDRLKVTEFKSVFAGTNKHRDPINICADECVGGTANTKAMEATN
jgi:hypothetical protein